MLLGKTNTHELGGGVTTINPFFGTTRNPVDRTRIPGGSSGGSAAAVVAHLCAAATGSDTGGSVRIPAAFCGCVGFKPTLRPHQHARPDRRVADLRSRRLPDAHRRRRADHRSAPSAGAPTSPAEPRIRVGVPRSYFFDRSRSASRIASRRAIARMGSTAHVSRTSTSRSTTKTMSRVFDPIVRVRDVGTLWRRLAHQSRIVLEGSSRLSSRSSAHRSREYEAALAALKEYQAAVDRALRFGRRHRHADRPDDRAADRRPDRRHEDPAQYLALQRRRHTGDFDPARKTAGLPVGPATHRPPRRRRQTLTNCPQRLRSTVTHRHSSPYASPKRKPQDLYFVRMQLKTSLVCLRRPRPDAVAGRAVRADAPRPRSPLQNNSSATTSAPTTCCRTTPSSPSS